MHRQRNLTRRIYTAILIAFIFFGIGAALYLFSLISSSLTSLITEGVVCTNAGITNSYLLVGVDQSGYEPLPGCLVELFADAECTRLLEKGVVVTDDTGRFRLLVPKESLTNAAGRDYCLRISKPGYESIQESFIPGPLWRYRFQTVVLRKIE